MTAELFVLLIVIIAALVFDFTNGFHDTANAMATSIATGALGPRTAVVLSGSLNLVGAFLSVEVASTVAKGIVRLDQVSGRDLLAIVFAGLVGGTDTTVSALEHSPHDDQEREPARTTATATAERISRDQ